jgi:uncharacterized protein (DUF1919 family)
MCIHDAWVVVTKRMKEQCSVIVISLIEELLQRFPNLEFMNVIGIVHHKYWFNYKANNMFPTHLTLLKVQHYFKNEVSVKGLKVPALLNEKKFDMEASLFKVIMH